jgi:hypothetical protein
LWGNDDVTAEQIFELQEALPDCEING